MTATATTPDTLADLLGGCVADRDQVRTTSSTRRALAHDASHFLLRARRPWSHPATPTRSAACCGPARRAGVPLTFRSGGTSLSGQAVTDGVLVDIRAALPGVEVLDDGRRVRVQPGRHRPPGQRPARPVRAQARARPGERDRLHDRRRGRRTTPRGMACGTIENTYRTLESLVVRAAVAAPSSTPAPRTRTSGCRPLEPALHEGLLALRDRVRGDPASVRDGRAPVLDEEHHGLRAQRVPRPRRAGRRSSRT